MPGAFRTSLRAQNQAEGSIRSSTFCGERDELPATLVALGDTRSSRLLGIMLGDTETELVHDTARSALLAYGPGRKRTAPNVEERGRPEP